ncbi:hypothetical protein ABZ465_32015 [Streptomyces griseoincarnatus]
MARTVSIDVSFAVPVDVSVAVRALIEGGMRHPARDGMTYLIDKVGLFEWKRSSPFLLAEVLSEMADPRWRDRVVGMTLHFPDGDGDVGGDLLFHPGRTSASFVACVNTKRLPDSVFCDTGWYLRRLVPLFEPLRLTEIGTLDSP